MMRILSLLFLIVAAGTALAIPFDRPFRLDANRGESTKGLCGGCSYATITVTAGQDFDEESEIELTTADVRFFNESGRMVTRGIFYIDIAESIANPVAEPNQRNLGRRSGGSQHILVQNGATNASYSWRFSRIVNRDGVDMISRLTIDDRSAEFYLSEEPYQEYRTQLRLNLATSKAKLCDI